MDGDLAEHLGLLPDRDPKIGGEAELEGGVLARDPELARHVHAQVEAGRSRRRRRSARGRSSCSALQLRGLRAVERQIAFHQDDVVRARQSAAGPCAWCRAARRARRRCRRPAGCRAAPRARAPAPSATRSPGAGPACRAGGDPASRPPRPRTDSVRRASRWRSRARGRRRSRRSARRAPPRRRRRGPSGGCSGTRRSPVSASRPSVHSSRPPSCGVRSVPRAVTDAVRRPAIVRSAGVTPDSPRSVEPLRVQPRVERRPSKVEAARHRRIAEIDLHRGRGVQRAAVRRRQPGIELRLVVGVARLDLRVADRHLVQVDVARLGVEERARRADRAVDGEVGVQVALERALRVVVALRREVPAAASRRVQTPRAARIGASASRAGD